MDNKRLVEEWNHESALALHRYVWEGMEKLRKTMGFDVAAWAQKMRVSESEYLKMLAENQPIPLNSAALLCQELGLSLESISNGVPISKNVV